jgi:hypothetical protein
MTPDCLSKACVYDSGISYNILYYYKIFTYLIRNMRLIDSLTALAPCAWAQPIILLVHDKIRRPGDFYDELPDHPPLRCPTDLAIRQKAAEALLLKMGITFNVYGRDEGTEKIMPFDIIPRIVSGDDWQQIESGLKQRIFALNEFIQDVYNDKKILKDKVVPEDLILTSRTYRKECEGSPRPGESGAM